MIRQSDAFAIDRRMKVSLAELEGRFQPQAFERRKVGAGDRSVACKPRQRARLALSRIKDVQVEKRKCVAEFREDRFSVGCGGGATGLKVTPSPSGKGLAQ